MPPLSEPLNTWTRDDVLEFAYRRGTRLRRRRLVVQSAAVAAGVLALAAPLALVLRDSPTSSNQRLQVVDTPPTTVPDLPPTDLETGALGPGDASGGAPPSQGAAPARKVVPPVQQQSPPTTQRPAELAACARNEVELTTTTDKASYLPTDTVRVTARIRNTSGHRCEAPTRSSLNIVGPDGRTAHADEKQANAAGAPFLSGTTVEVVFEWTPGMATQGGYTARVSWKAGGDYGPSAASFTVAVA